MDIEKYLIKLGLNPSLKGFGYIVKSLQLVRENPDLKTETTRKLYPELAKIFNKKPGTIERCIQYCLYNAGIFEGVAKFIATLEINTR